MMRYIYLFLFVCISTSVCGQSARAIKKSKIEYLHQDQLPVDPQRLDFGFTQFARGIFNKDYIIKGKVSIIGVASSIRSSNPNPMRVNITENRVYYYLQHNQAGSPYREFFVGKRAKDPIQELSKASIIAVLGKEYKDRVEALKKVTMSAVKKLVEDYNETYTGS